MSKTITLELNDKETEIYDKIIKEVYHNHEEEFLAAIADGIVAFFDQYNKTEEFLNDSLSKLIELKNCNRLLTPEEVIPDLLPRMVSPTIPTNLYYAACCCCNIGGSK